MRQARARQSSVRGWDLKEHIAAFALIEAFGVEIKRS
jgi:hypothetical protein